MNPTQVPVRAYKFFKYLFFDPVAIGRRVAEMPTYFRNARRYRQLDSSFDALFPFTLAYLKPIFGDRGQSAGDASGHYFHQDIWAAREIHKRSPARHVDIGSSVAGFIAHLLSFREVEYVDIRPLTTNVTGLHYISGDLTNLPFDDQSLDSLSSLHVVEHVGLGRYGDTVDPDGWFKACKELQRVLRPGGFLYFSVPIGYQRLEFDAHRVFNPMTIVRAFDQLDLLSFSFVDDRGDHVPAGDLTQFQGRLCCGLFLFKRNEQSASTVLDPKSDP